MSVVYEGEKNKQKTKQWGDRRAHQRMLENACTRWPSTVFEFPGFVSVQKKIARKRKIMNICTWHINIFKYKKKEKKNDCNH